MEEIKKEVKKRYEKLKQQHEGLERAQQLTDSVLRDLMQMQYLLEEWEKKTKK